MTQLEDIAKALRQIADQIEELSGASKDAPATPQIEPGTVIALEDVRAVLTKVSGKHGAAAVKELLAPHKKLSDVPPVEWAALIAKAETVND